MRLILLLFCLVMAVSAVQAQVVEQDSLALVAFYASTDGANWQNSTNWLTGPVSTWHGVTIADDRVSALRFDDNGLRGVVPGAIGQLDDLTVLQLPNNALLELPAAIGQLSHLRELDLRGNHLRTLPDELNTLTALRTLVLDNNPLHGDRLSSLAGLTDLRRFSITRMYLCKPAGARIDQWPFAFGWLWDDLNVCEPTLSEQELQAEPCRGSALHFASNRQRIYFRRNVTTLTYENELILAENVAMLNACPDMDMRIEGIGAHHERNPLRLAEQRVEIVKQFYLDRGIAPDRLSTHARTRRACGKKFAPISRSVGTLPLSRASEK